MQQVALKITERNPVFACHLPNVVDFVNFCHVALPIRYLGYVVYGWRKAKGQHVSVISTSTDEPDERGLHK